MIGIIGAMDVEVDALKAKVQDSTVTKYAGVDFVCGRVEDVMVCVAQCGIGKVNAALCTQAMIDKFAVEKVINVGVAGSLRDYVGLKNIVVATDVCQHDMDITALGDPKGFINGLNMIKIPTDKDLSEKLARSAINCGEKIHRGTIASGDIFIASTALKQQIVADFDALCGEMEGAAIGHVCAANGVAFAVLRSISDGGNEDSHIDYPTFKKIAAEMTTAIIVNYIKTEKVQLTFDKATF